MAVQFISYVDQDVLGNWFIKLTDTLEEKDVICKDLDDYAKKIEELGADYGNDIEVKWIKSNRLTPANYQDISIKMAIFQEKYKKEIEEINAKK